MKTRKLARPADALPPAACLVASLLGREAVALMLFFGVQIARLCALATADALRAAFARQPSVRYVQGSALVALILQAVGMAAALPAGRALRLPAALIACGGLLNIEHIFYEYMYAIGDGGSAARLHALSAGLILLGLLLGCPPERGIENPSAIALLPILIACGLAALIGLFVSLMLGGRLRPRLNPQVLRRCPRALLEAALWPALFELGKRLASDALFLRAAPPLFVGLIVIALCRAPFRRAPEESGPMNRALLLACAASLAGLIPFMAGLRPAGAPHDVPRMLAAVPPAALCAFVLYGNVPKRINMQ